MKTIKEFWLLIFLAFICVAIVFFLTIELIIRRASLSTKIFSPSPQSNQTINSGSGYSAVFLTNGQVYFGKLANAATDHPVLTDVFYLKVQRDIQPDETDSTAVKDSAVREAQPATDFKLIKLGSEFFAPTDRIELNRDHILFWENLRADSKVVEAIRNYNSK